MASLLVIFPGSSRVVRFPVPEDGVKRIAATKTSCRVLSQSGRIYTVKPTGLALIPFSYTVTDIACGPDHMLLLTDDTRFPVFALGDNAYGQLGASGKRSSATPVPVPFLAGQKVAGVFAGAQHSAVATTSGVVVWGGTPYPEPVATQTFPSLAFNGGMVMQMVLGVEGWAAVTGSGAVYTFDFADGDSPDKLDGLLWRYQIIQLACDDVSTFYVLTKCGRVFEWTAAAGETPSPKLLSVAGDDKWHALSMLRLRPSTATSSSATPARGCLALVNSGLRTLILSPTIQDTLKDELSRLWVASLASTESYITLMGCADPLLSRSWAAPTASDNILSRDAIRSAASLADVDTAITASLQGQCNADLQRCLSVLHDAVVADGDDVAVAAGADVVFTLRGERFWGHRTLVASRSGVLARVIAEAVPIDVDSKESVLLSAHNVLAVSGPADEPDHAVADPTAPSSSSSSSPVTPAWALRGHNHELPLYGTRIEVSLDRLPLTATQFRVARQFMYTGTISNTTAEAHVDLNSVARVLDIPALFDAPSSPSVQWTADTCARMGAVLFNAAKVGCTLEDAAVKEYGSGAAAGDDQLQQRDQFGGDDDDEDDGDGGGGGEEATKINYTQLPALDTKYREAGLRILAFPCNQFGAQEPGTVEEIKAFTAGYGIEFDLFSKGDVNGDNTRPVFKYLKDKLPGFMYTTRIKWNFTKFLIDRDGKPFKRYGPNEAPFSFEKDIKSLLDKPSSNGYPVPTPHPFTASVAGAESSEAAVSESVAPVADPSAEAEGDASLPPSPPASASTVTPATPNL